MGKPFYAPAFGALTFALCLYTGAAGAEPGGDERGVRNRSVTIKLANLQEQFADIARQVAPSVVAISASSAPISLDGPAGPLTAGQLQAVLADTRHGVGAGFVIDPNGYILTNEHVVAGRDNLCIITDDRKIYPAVVVGTDRRMDLAVVKIPARSLSVAKLAQAAQTSRGQWTITLGNPWGLAEGGELSMSVGVVSAVGRTLPLLARRDDRDYTNLIQTTAEVNPGNSGGALFNLEGEVIGVVTAVSLPGVLNPHALGFAIPMTPQVVQRVEQLKQRGSESETRLRWRGVLLGTVPPHWRAGGDSNDNPPGVMVLAVDPDSPFVAQGLAPGTIITGLGGQGVQSVDDLKVVLTRLPQEFIEIQTAQASAAATDAILPSALDHP